MITYTVLSNKNTIVTRLFLYGRQSTIGVLDLIEHLTYTPKSIYATTLVRADNGEWNTYETDPITGLQVSFRMRAPGDGMLRFDPSDALHNGYTEGAYSVLTAQKATAEIVISWDGNPGVFDASGKAGRWILYSISLWRGSPTLADAYYTGVSGGLLYKVENLVPSDAAAFDRPRRLRDGPIGRSLHNAVYWSWKRAELDLDGQS